VDLEAARSKILRCPRRRSRRLGQVLREGWYFLLPLVALVYALFGLNYERRWLGWWRPRSCSSRGCPSVQGQAHRLFAISTRCCATRELVLDLFMLGAAAGIMNGALTTREWIHADARADISRGRKVRRAARATAIANIIWAGGCDVGVSSSLATLVAPALVKMGIAPMAATCSSCTTCR